MTQRLLPSLILILVACAHYPRTIAAPVVTVAGASTSQGYRFENFPADGKNTDSLFVILTFSGGGTRAAAFAYGVLRELAQTPIDTGSRTRTLLEEVDVISTVWAARLRAGSTHCTDRIHLRPLSRAFSRGMPKALSRKGCCRRTLSGSRLPPSVGAISRLQRGTDDFFTEQHSAPSSSAANAPTC